MLKLATSLFTTANADYMKKILYLLATLSVFIPSVSLASATFVGDPKTRAEILRCEVVVSKYSKKVYQKGNKIILTMAPKWAHCPAPKITSKLILPPAPVLPVKTAAQIQLELEALNMSLYGDARGPQIKAYTPAPVVQAPQMPQNPVSMPVPQPVVIQPIVQSTPDAIIVGSPAVQEDEDPHFIGAPYSIPVSYPHQNDVGYAVKFSENAVSDPHQSIYRFFCTSEWDPNGINFPTYVGEDAKTRVSYAVGNSGSPTSFTCRFRFNLPTGTIESETVTFIL